MSKSSRAIQKARLDGMMDYELANLAATLVYIMLGSRAFSALGVLLSAQIEVKR